VKNIGHQWRIRPVPSTLAICRMCRIERVCSAFDHDLRGHLCDEDAFHVRNAEAALAGAGIELEPTDSIISNPL
jgi:hypothetical protein